VTSFIDSSALVKRYVAEPDSEFANSLMVADKVIATSWLTVADSLGVRSLDAMQLAAAQRLRVSNLTFITFDLRQANAARTLGFHVVGC